MELKALQLRDASVCASRALLEILRERPEGQRRVWLSAPIDICGPDGERIDTIAGVDAGASSGDAIGEPTTLYLLTENTVLEMRFDDQDPWIIQQICSELNKNL